MAVMAATLPLIHETSGGLHPLLAGILDVPTETLRAWLADRGQPPMRVNQIRRQVLANRATAFEEMSDLPKQLRAELAEAFSVFSTRVERHLTASDGTHKLILRLADDRMIESVLIQDEGRATACISTQVGCGMGCVFCASGINGVVRNLTAGEIVEQLVRLRNLVEARSAENENQPGSASEDPLGLHSALRAPRSALPRLTHIVVMGMGEPLANPDNLLAALAVAGEKNGLGIGARHITISTVGLPAKIRRLADLGKQYHLAVSLHAPDDALRTRIVPTNDKTGLDAILASADYFFEKTGRQVTFEYVLLGGINDAESHAEGLARLLEGRCAHVNVIPFNDVPGLPYRRPTAEALAAFLSPLRQRKISVKVRKRKGAQIDAACGQLRRSVSSQ